MRTRALSDLKVIELGNLVSVPFCTKFLASLGAEVIKVEKPGTGDDARKLGPFFQDVPHPEHSGLFLYLNTGKMGITLDLETKTGLSIFHDLIKSADILVENNLPREMQRLGLDYDALKEINSKLIITSVTPFGGSGPYRDYKATDLVSFHASGLGYITPRPLAGETDEGPLRVKGRLADFIAGLDAAAGTMCAVYERDRTGIGQHLDISVQESVTAGMANPIAAASYTETAIGRVGQFAFMPLATMACKDGYVDIQCMNEDHWRGLVEVMGNPDWADLEVFKDPFARGENWDALAPLMSDWLMGQSKQELYLAAQAHGVPLAPVNTIEELVKSDQLAGRDFFVETEQPDVGILRYPGLPLRLSRTPPGADQRAPLLGEHNEEIYCGRLGYSRADLVWMRNAGVI